MTVIVILWNFAEKLSTAESVIHWWSNIKSSLTAVLGAADPFWYQLVLLVLGLAWIAYVASRPEPVLSAPVGIKPTWFPSQGFYWELLPNFYSQYRLFPPDGATTQSALQNFFLGPYCFNTSHCKMLVGDDLLNGARTCSRCGHPLNPKIEIKAEGPRHGIASIASYDPLWPLRKAAYREAIAAAQEGKLRPGQEASVPPKDFVAIGEGLLAEIKSVVSEDALHLLMRQMNRWEQEICDWLKQRDQKALEIFISNFEILSGSDLKGTLVCRVSTRLERLKNALLRLGN